VRYDGTSNDEETTMAKCPHCQGEVTLATTRKDEGPTEVHKDVQGFIKKEVMYSCPHCDRVLGFAFFPGGVLTGRP
jgi:phage FluMu protein Com